MLRKHYQEKQKRTLINWDSRKVKINKLENKQKEFLIELNKLKEECKFNPVISKINRIEELEYSIKLIESKKN